MDTIERIKKYIANTNSYRPEIYDMSVNDWKKMVDVALCTPFDAISLAFFYGRAKGYRAAKAEMKQKNPPESVQDPTVF